MDRLSLLEKQVEDLARRVEALESVNPPASEEKLSPPTPGYFAEPEPGFDEDAK